MDEARRVLARLERIEALERDDALPGDLLRELRALLAEAEAWARTERTIPENTAQAVERCQKAVRDASRTLLA